VEVGIGVKDLQAAHKEDQERQDVDPVSQASGPVVAIDWQSYFLSRKGVPVSFIKRLEI
jgi:hypothetical protein